MTGPERTHHAATQTDGTEMRIPATVSEPSPSEHLAAPAASGPQPFLLETLVHVGDELGVAVEQQRRPPLPDGPADRGLGRLAPARMRHLRVDVGPETVFRGLQRLPIGLGPLVREG